MEEEERWIRMLRGLNILPLIVCILLLYIQLLNLKYRFNIINVSFNLLSLLSILAYVMSFVIKIEECKKQRKLIVWSIGLITTFIWSILFSNVVVNFFSEDEDILVKYAFFIFIIGYPLIMLYYNFRLFMNEISKP